jgi:hypothetical protein
MKLLEILKKINNSNFAKTLTGIAVVLIGAGTTLIPVIGSVAGPVIMSAGSLIITGGIVDKVVRSRNGGDPLAHEKNLVNIVKTKLNGIKNGETH